MIRISSSKNKIIKQLRLLKNKKYRYKFGMYFLEGLRLVEEAVFSGAKLKRIILSSDFDVSSAKWLSRYSEISYMVERSLFASIAETKTSQGIMAVFSTHQYNYENILNKGTHFVFLENIQDPGNLGTIIRTADAANFDALVLSKGCVDVYNPKVLRATMGSFCHIPVFVVDDFTAAIIKAKEDRKKVVAADPKGKDSIYAADISGDIVILVGNEGNGLSDDSSSLADLKLTIPMPGKAESLNVSVAASILMYEVVRQNLKND